MLAGAAAAVVVLLGVPLGLAVSPVFAVRRIVVDGASAPVAAAVRARLAGLTGTPLALVDPAAVRRSVQAVPQVASYRASSLPPGTVQVRIVERVPVGQLRQAAGWAQVDPAGVVVGTAGTRLAGRPVLDVPAASGPRFAAAVAVLQALPSTVLERVVTIRAPGADDVSLRLGSGLTVSWGSPDDGAAKGAALKAALKHVAHGATIVDVSAPGLVTVR
jgi:cell division protein FtsQ